MVPLIATKAELDLVEAGIDAMAEAVARETGTKVAYQVGTMIEPPAGRRCAPPRSPRPRNSTFGTNDLTQTAFGIGATTPRAFSAPTWRAEFSRRSVRLHRPRGVGELVRIGVERGREDEQLKVGICGEHGGDPASVAFCNEIALDYVSCSPFRVPIARLAAAQAALGKARRRRSLRRVGNLRSDREAQDRQ